MQDLAQQHCLNHPLREAVARCPECRQFYCRECITEHDDRVICAACLLKVAQSGKEKKFRLARLAQLGTCLLGLVTAWLFFNWMGEALSTIPTKFHDGTVWKTDFWDEYHGQNLS